MASVIARFCTEVSKILGEKVIHDADTTHYRYKQDLVPEQKEILFDVIKHKHHPEIAAEVRRELAHAQARDAIDQMDYDSDILMD